MFSLGGAFRFMLSRLWPGLVAAAIIIVAIPNRVAAALGLVFVIAIAACRELMRYGKAWDKHKYLSSKYGDAYSAKLKTYLAQFGLDGYVQLGWVVLEVELEKGRRTA